MKRSKSSRARARRWTSAEASAVLEELARSGLPVVQFAARHGFGIERLYRWKRRLQHRAKPETKAPRFREITLRPPSVPAAVELVFPDGVAVRLAGASRLDDALAILSGLRRS